MISRSGRCVARRPFHSEQGREFRVPGRSCAPRSHRQSVSYALKPGYPPWRRPVSGNNGSAFFFRLPLHAKSAMAEILVSDLCECRPPLLIGGRFHVCRPGPHATMPAGVFHLFCFFFPLFFFFFSLVFFSGGFSSPSPVRAFCL